jgi:hypothetical protein
VNTVRLAAFFPVAAVGSKFETRTARSFGWRQPGPDQIGRAGLEVKSEFAVHLGFESAAAEKRSPVKQHG